MMRPFATAVYKLHIPHDGLNGKALKIAYFTDLHNCCSPEETLYILDRLEEIRPDLVLCGGDSIVARPGASAGSAVRFLLQVAERHTLVIGTGNHEYRSRLYPETYGSLYSDYREPLLRAGVRLLENENEPFLLHDVPVCIYGFDMPRYFYGRLKAADMPVSELYDALGTPDEHSFTILLAHNPRALPSYLSWGADLTLCGHYHGGIMRIGSHHGLVSPEFRPFPANAYGHFQKRNKHVIISSGCGEHTLPIRIRNPREIVRMDIQFMNRG